MGEIEYTFEDAEDFIQNVIVKADPPFNMPLERYRKAVKDGKSVLECMYCYLDMSDDTVNMFKKCGVFYMERIKECIVIRSALTLKFEDLPLHINSCTERLRRHPLNTNGISDVRVKDIVAWRLGIGK